MTINRISILRTSALVAFITTACAHLAPSQQVGSPFPKRPPGAECEHRLQRLRAVATPTVKHDQLRNAFVPLYGCKDRELGQGIAAAIVAVRATTDSSTAFMAFHGAFAYRDSAIVRAAVQVAGDRSASEIMRVLGFLSLYTTLAPGGYLPSLREFITRPPGDMPCGFSITTHSGDVVELTPRGPGLIASIGDVARSVLSDPAASRALRSSATCVLGVWRP